jgi:predicted RecB family nuclease
MKITPSLFHAHIKCPTKCWLRFTGEPATGNPYAEWAQSQNESYRDTAIERLRSEMPQDECAIAPAQESLKTSKWRLGFDVAVATSQNLETRLQAVERVAPEGRGKSARLIPIRFVFTNKLGRDEKLLLGFDAIVLSEILGREVSLGKIIHGDNHSRLKVKTTTLAGEVRKRIEKMTALLSSPSAPDLILNRHCAECEFQAGCRQKAIEKDDLSLLATMSEKERKKLRAKGIFTVTQLSYTFRPRRRPRLLRGKREKYHHSLKALAIREKKIHIVGNPELKIEGTPVYLDVEGLPDRDFYYLIGVRVGNGESAIQHSLWADKTEDEQRIWTEFLTIIKAVARPVLIHYGSYETTFLKNMIERNGHPAGDGAMVGVIKSSVNLISTTFAQVYFPTLTNGLKDTARHLGFSWAEAGANGLQTICWRFRWEQSHGTEFKERLMRYNAQDCEALEVVTNRLIELNQSPLHGGEASLNGVVDTTKMKWEHPYGFKRNKFASPELDAINKAAYWDYQRDRIYVKTHRGLKRALKLASRPNMSFKPNKTIDCPRPDNCPKCRSARFFGHGKFVKTIFDLKFMRHGLKRWIIRYRFHRYQCQVCGSTFLPEDRHWNGDKFGTCIVAYALYQNIELRLPSEHVDHSLNKLFGFNLMTGTNRFKAKAAEKYRTTHERLVKSLCSGRLLHADETKISVQGNNGFVWVLANMEEVAYIYSETREGDFLHALLKDFTGVLISDFYAAYDGIQCRQQKCLIHLIRDLNDAVLKHPYDQELKWLALEFGSLVKPMVETVDRFGLKGRFLRKYLPVVNRFYRGLAKTDLKSELAAKLKDRFMKNREKLFTFLTVDGVPWNNNNAEHAVKPFAMLRRVIAGVTTEKGIKDYLILLSICQTCKYMGVDFLDFLRSGEKDIQTFAESRSGRDGRGVSIHSVAYA